MNIFFTKQQHSQTLYQSVSKPDLLKAIDICMNVDITFTLRLWSRMFHLVILWMLGQSLKTFEPNPANTVTPLLKAVTHGGSNYKCFPPTNLIISAPVAPVGSQTGQVKVRQARQGVGEVCGVRLHGGVGGLGGGGWRREDGVPAGRQICRDFPFTCRSLSTACRLINKQFEHEESPLILC